MSDEQATMSDEQATEFCESLSDLIDAPLRRRYVVTDPCPINKRRFRIQSLTEGELSSYQAMALGKDGFKQARMEDANRRLIARCLVDRNGNRLLSDSQAVKLIAWDSADTHFLYNACAEHVGLKREDVEALGKN